MKKIVAMTIHTTAEGKRCAYMYSEIDSEGNIIEANKRGNLVVLDKTALGGIAKLEAFIDAKLNPPEVTE